MFARRYPTTFESALYVVLAVVRGVLRTGDNWRWWSSWSGCLTVDAKVGPKRCGALAAPAPRVR
jgi:hypothetical protein